ncbi:MAG: hypothetical protein K2P35_03965 [Lachnospiraceae bacterium]|nr:hypothetical protein [Lachnospiraceae bacterium]
MTTLSLLLLLLLCSLTGCATTPKEVSDTQNNTTADANMPDTNFPAENTQSETEEESDFPGSYTVPDGWVKVEQYSSADKFFYVEDGHENDETPDNISIEVGTNRYSEEEHEDFRNAIVRQLTMQLQGVSADVTGDGTHTDQDYIVYIFTISEEDVVTKQYYIVGDQRYCLIHLTNFTGSESAVEAAQAMVDSFVWN